MSPPCSELQSAYYAEDECPFVESIAGKAWNRLLPNPRLGSAWVIEAQSRLVGYVVVTLGYSLEYGGQDASIDELYLAPAWRGRGLGHQGLKAVDAACIQLGVEALHLEVERDKTAAQALYRRWGFADRERVLMTKSIGPPPGLSRSSTGNG